MERRKLPISAFIIAKNEADRIPTAIESVIEWVDEVIVVDSGSTDSTVEIAKAHGASVYYNDWSGYGPQKVFSEGLCRNNWLLNLDADEEVSTELQAEIINLFRVGELQCTAYTMPILPLYPFQDQGHPWTAFHSPIRLYDKRRAGFKDSPVHDSVVVQAGKTGRLNGMVIHRSFRSLTHHIEKANEVSTLRAEHLVKRNKIPSGLSLLLIPMLAFFKSYIMRREFVNGVDGIIISHMYAFQRFIRLAKAREMHRLARRKATDGHS